MVKRKETTKTWVLQAILISLLRRAFVKSPMFTATRKAAQREKVTYNKDGSVSGRRRVEYKCAMCGEYFDDCKVTIQKTDKKGKSKPKTVHNIAVDHVEPFVPVEGLPRRDNGLPDWNVLIDRMMLSIDVWDPSVDTYSRIQDKARILCWKCHEEVTQEQNQQRREHKKAKEEPKKTKKTKG